MLVAGVAGPKLTTAVVRSPAPAEIDSRATSVAEVITIVAVVVRAVVVRVAVEHTGVLNRAD